MAGTLSVQKIQGLASSATPTTVEIASGHKLTGAAGSIVAPGQVIQTLQVVDEASATTTSGSFVTTPLSLAITPSSTSSKILITTTFMMGFSTSDQSPSFTLYRGSTNLSGAGAAAFSANGSSGGDMNSTDQYRVRQAAMTYLDSPNTTSATTYAVYMKTTGGQAARFNINRQGESGAIHTAVMILQEIAG